MIYQCHFGQNLAIASEDRAQCFHSYMTLVTLKIRPRSPKSDHFYDPPNGVSVSVWSTLAISSEERVEPRLLHIHT